MLKQQAQHVIFRCDASNTIGTGHVMRCLTLAHALHNKGAICAFVCRKAQGNLLEYIEQQGFKTHVLPESINTNEDHTLTAAFVKTLKHPPEWLVVDHYFLDKTWESHLRPHVHKIMVIDDLANRPHDCDLLLDQNMVPDMAHRYVGRLPDRCTQLLGPKYALLRPEFAEERRHIMNRTFPPKHILLNFGGGDKEGMILKSLQALYIAGYADKLTVVAGSQNPDAQLIEAACQKRPNTTYFATTHDMAKLMRAADLAIGAGGSTTWERMCLGLPCVTVTIADNQVEIAKFLSDNHYTFYAGFAAELTPEKLAKYLEKVFQDKEKFRGIEQYAHNHVDGNGTDIIADILLSKKSAK